LARELNWPSGPVTGISTLAAWLTQSDRSSALGRRAAAGGVRRNSDEAPPRQLGLTGLVRRGAWLATWGLAERFSGMATTSL
jgi:hypothetical protein